MTATEAIKALERGKCVGLAGVTNRYFRLYRNDTICQLNPTGACCATVELQYTPDEFESEGFRMEFELYDPNTMKTISQVP